MFKSWSERIVTVSRESISYERHASRKKVFSVENEIGRPSLCAGYSHQSGVFQIRCDNKVVILQADDWHVRNLWLHSIQCVLDKVFDHAFKASPIPNISNYPGYPTGESNSYDTYLRFGRMALKEQSINKQKEMLYHQNTNAINRNTSFSQENSSESALTYKMLNLCAVTAPGGPENAVSIEGIVDPTKMKMNISEYDFKLEKSVLDLN